MLPCPGHQGRPATPVEIGKGALQVWARPIGREQVAIHPCGAALGGKVRGSRQRTLRRIHSSMGRRSLALTPGPLARDRARDGRPAGRCPAAAILPDVRARRGQPARVDPLRVVAAQIAQDGIVDHPDAIRLLAEPVRTIRTEAAKVEPPAAAGRPPEISRPTTLQSTLVEIPEANVIARIVKHRRLGEQIQHALRPPAPGPAGCPELWAQLRRKRSPASPADTATKPSLSWPAASRSDSSGRLPSSGSPAVLRTTATPCSRRHGQRRLK